MNNNATTPEILYQFLILKTLINMTNGSAERNEILSYIKLHHGNLLTKKDLDDYDSGNGKRCENHISFARQHLIDSGCLARSSPYGIWEITLQGRQQYREWAELLKQGLTQPKK